MSAPLRVSVIIATYRREEVLCNTIRQVLADPYEPKEVLVIDQTPDHVPETRSFLGSVGDRIRYFFRPAPGVTAAENHGIREATGDIVLFLDDDVSFEPGLIAKHVRNYRDPRVTGVAGQILLPGSRPTTRLSDVCRCRSFGYYFFRHDYAHRVRVANVQECNASFRREALLGVGLVDEQFTENAYLWGMDLTLRVVEAGGRIIHDPEATAIHLVHPAGGVRMKTVRPVSYFRNLFYFLHKHADRHAAFSIALRVFFLTVFVMGWRRPWSIPTNTLGYLRAWFSSRSDSTRAESRGRLSCV